MKYVFNLIVYLFFFVFQTIIAKSSNNSQYGQIEIVCLWKLRDFCVLIDYVRLFQIPFDIIYFFAKLFFTVIY